MKSLVNNLKFTGHVTTNGALRAQRISLLFLALLLLNGCGVGLCAGGERSGGCLAVGGGDSNLLTPRLVLSGLSGVTIRKNDCYPVTLSAVDAAGNAMTEVTASVTISASSGLVLYSSLQGCQTYDSAFEKSDFTLTPASPTAVFYFRSDTEGEVSLSASASPSVGIAGADQPLAVSYVAFDPTKGPDGPVVVFAQDPLGRTYLGGSFTTFDDLSVRYIARANSNGALDTSFVQMGSGLNAGGVSSLALQSDGKVMVGGGFTSYNGTSRPYVARLNTDGSLDTSFAPTGSGLNSGVDALSLQSDGKVLVGGSFTSYNGTSRPYVARLNSDGTLDTSFSQVGSGLNGNILAVSLQSDGKVLVGGSGFTSYNGTTARYVARINSDGTLDTSFVQTGSGLNGGLYNLYLQGDGKILVVGYFDYYNGSYRPRIARLNSDGSLDFSFATTGSGFDVPFVYVLEVSTQSNGKILVGGGFTDYNGTSLLRFGRLNSDGSLDTGFASGQITGQPSGIFVQNDDKILIGAGSYSRFARLDSDGTLDTGFAQTENGFNQTVFALTLQSDGKALVGGGFSAHNATTIGRVARLNGDGTLDTSFAPTGSGLNASVFGLSHQSDGKVLVGGSFTSYNGTNAPYVARLNSDGTLDASFAQIGSGLSGNVYAVSHQSDGKVLVGGDFTSYNGTPRARIARLNSDGSLDTGFAIGSGVLSTANAICVQSDGKVLVGGGFTSYNGTSRRRVARINSDGSLDTSFVHVGSGLNGEVKGLSLQSDGKVLAGGFFDSYNGTARYNVVRLNANGSLDTGFVPTGSGLNGQVNTLSHQSDGKVLVGGQFSSYNGTARNRAARLNSDGSLDTGFGASGSGASDWVNAFAIRSDGKILVGGYFSSYALSTVNYLARLTYIGTVD